MTGWRADGWTQPALALRLTPPRRRRGGKLTRRQRMALDFLAMRPRTIPELAAILGISNERAAVTATSLVRRRKATTYRDSAGALRFAAKTANGPP